MVQATVAVRVDVDTHRGLHEGVPRLLDLLGALGVAASFFVTMGPDRSGRALRRAWRPSFLRKMWRTNPLRLYGLRTLVSGTLLPAPLVGSGAPALLRRIAAAGHEVAPHGFDHVGWQDGAHRWPAAAIRADLAAAAGAYEAALGTPPAASAAPGWRTTALALRVQEELGYRYASDTRGVRPFRPRGPGGALKTLQLPTTMPTMDELAIRDPAVADALARAVRPGLNVFTAHAEVEGGALLDAFAHFLQRARAAGVVFPRLVDVASAVAAETLPVSEVTRASVPGRSGWVAVQGAVTWTD